MKLLGCFKIVPDLEMLSNEDWVTDDTQYVDTDFVKTDWNCFDESGLEMMLKLSDYSKSSNIICELSALTIGKENCDSYLRILYALGFQRTIRVDCRENISYWPELVARAIANYVKNKGLQSVVVMGRQSADGDNGKTPLLTAEMLGFPCITQVIKLEPVDDEHLKIYSMIEEGILTQIVKIPCVISVGDAPNSYLRVPTLKDRMNLGKQPIDYYTFEDLDINKKELVQGLKPLSVVQIKNYRQTEVISADTAEKAAKILYDSYLKERLEKL